MLAEESRLGRLGQYWAAIRIKLGQVSSQFCIKMLRVFLIRRSVSSTMRRKERGKTS